MATAGLLALIDDVASIADDVATLTLEATQKTSGIVTDDLAVTAERTLGLAAEREVPVILAVARGSMWNKAALLAPGALALNAVAPFVIHPILMAGGTFLCFEGVEKLLHRGGDHADAHGHDAPHGEGPADPAAHEAERIQGAIRTDLILSGEIIVITLGEVAHTPFFTQVLVLYGVSVVLTVAVYGLVIGLVKIDDVGAHMVLRGGPTAGLGAWILRGAPLLLHAISWIGTFAMLLVGGHILLEGIHPLEEAVHHALAPLHGVAGTLAGIGVDLVVGGVAGALVVGALATGVPGRLWARVRGTP